MISHQFVVAFQKVHVSNVPPHFSHLKPQVSSERKLNSLTKQGMQNIRGLHRKGLTEREEKE